MQDIVDFVYLCYSVLKDNDGTLRLSKNLARVVHVDVETGTISLLDHETVTDSFMVGSR